MEIINKREIEPNNSKRQPSVLCLLHYKKAAGRIFPVGKLSGDTHVGTEGGFNSTNLHLTDFPSNMHIRAERALLASNKQH
jgi:hypothetical protein